jgi:23S rRNA pseudouridine2605 synthase
MTEERLQKILARSGFGSRRSNEELISAGRVKVNGKIAFLGMKADPSVDDIVVDGTSIPKAEGAIYIALYKPRYVLSDQASGDPRRNVRDLVDIPGHLFTIGRLDLDSEGLMILTNDGDLTNRITHPRYGHDKEYMVLLATRPDDEQLAIWQRGVVLEDGFRTAPSKVSIAKLQGKGAWVRVIMREGHKRQIREIGKVIGLPVVKLIRVRIATVKLNNLKPGDWRHLTREEVKELKSSATGKYAAKPEKLTRRSGYQKINRNSKKTR